MNPSTNPIGKGTCNIPINVPIEERGVIGKLASGKGESAGSFLRRMIVRGMQAEGHLSEAALIEEIRKARAALIVLTVFLMAIVAPTFVSAKKVCKDIRRTASVRTVRNPRRTDYELELIEA